MKNWDTLDADVVRLPPLRHPRLSRPGHQLLTQPQTMHRTVLSGTRVPVDRPDVRGQLVECVPAFVADDALIGVGESAVLAVAVRVPDPHRASRML